MRSKPTIRCWAQTLILAATFSAVGCAVDAGRKLSEALSRDVHWPLIRAAAEIEIARQDGTTEWSHAAYYSPRAHTNGVWVVVVAGAYPSNRFGDSVVVLVRDDHSIAGYQPSRFRHGR